MVMAFSHLIAESVAKFSDEITADLTALQTQVVEKGKVKEDRVENVWFDFGLQKMKRGVRFSESLEV